MSEKHDVDETTKNELPNGISRRNALRKIGAAGSVAVGGYAVSGTAAAQSRGPLPDDLNIDTLNGEERTDVLNRALQQERVSAFVEEFSERGWHTSDEQKKAYKVTSDQENANYTAATFLFSTENSGDAYVVWNSVNKFVPYAQKVENTGSDEWHVTTFRYERATETVTTTEDTVSGSQFASQIEGGGITTQHHGLCGVGKKVNFVCLGANAGVVLTVSGACGACLPTGNPLSPACQTCFGALSGSAYALRQIDCNICVPA